MTYEEFIKSFKKKLASPLYLVYGEEELLVEEVTEALADAAMSRENRGFNFDVVYASKSDIPAIAALASSFPMMGDKRVVIVRNADKLTDTGEEGEGGASKEKKADALTAYVEHPLQSTIMIFVGTKPDFRRKLFKIVRDTGETIECKKIRDYQYGTWIDQRAVKHGLTVAPDANRLLLEYAGDSLRSIDIELEKIKSSLGTRTQVLEEDVRSIVGASKRYTVFDLTNAVGMRDAASANRIVERMLDVGESPQMIIVMLTRALQQLWKLHELRAKNLPDDQLARELGLKHTFFLKQTLDHARQYPVQRLEAGFRALLAADLELKSTQTDQHLVMSVLIHAIMGDGTTMEEVLTPPLFN